MLDFFSAIGLVIVSFFLKYGHYFMPLLFIIHSLVFIHQYKNALENKKGEHKAPLIKTIIFAFLSGYYIVMSFSRFYGLYKPHIYGPTFSYVYYYSVALFPVIVGIMLMYKTIASLIKYIKTPRVDNKKHKALASFLTWAVVTIVYYIILYFTEFLFFIAPVV